MQTCPKCGSQLELYKGKKYVCSNGHCDFSVSKAKASKETPVVSRSESPGVSAYRGERLLSLIPKLPSTLALVLDEYTREENDYIALHAMCAALEFTARFLTIIVLADLVHKGQGFSDKLQKQLCWSFNAPTLGGWRYLLNAAVRELPGEGKQKECFLPQLPAYAATFLDALGGGKEPPEQKLLPMRNQLAHGGRVSEEMTQAFLKAHTQRFEDLILRLDFLSEDHDVKLVASPADAEAIWLRGLPGTWETFNRAHLPEEFQQNEPDRILLVKPKEALDLFPLHAYGEIFQIEKNRPVGKGEEAIHIFSRREKPNGVGYTVLGSRETHSRGKQAWEDRFADIFRIEAWQYQQQTKRAMTKYAFIRRMDELLELFIGRDEQVAAAAKRIEATESGILWLGGKPGMGKSAFMAKLVRDAFQHKTEVTIIPYFFQLSDGEMCRTVSFLEAAIMRIARATEQQIRPKDEPHERLMQFKTLLKDYAQQGSKKLVFFVDGLDEIAGVEPRFIDIIFDCQHPGVLWVCAGRDEEMLQQRFSRTLGAQASRLHSVDSRENGSPPLVGGVRGNTVDLRKIHRLKILRMLD